jgi:hypothetical protein
MKLIPRFLSFLLLFCLTACGAVISIHFPDAPTLVPTVATATQTARPTATASPTALAGILATTTANVNLRSIPTTANNTPIRVLPTGTQIRLIARLADNTWAKTSEGWVYTQNLSISDNLNSLPIWTPEPTPTQERLGKSRISYNANGNAIPDMSYFLSVMTSPCKTTALIMDNLNLAVQIKQLCPDTIVISRSWSALEGDEWYYRSPQNFIEQWQREGHPEIIRHSTNEPSFGGTRSLAQFAATETELMRLARQAGFTVTVGNFSVGYYQPEQINSGGFDSYLRAINQYGHYLGLHEYAVIALPFGVGQWPVEALLDRNRVQVAIWPTVQMLPIQLQNGQLPNYWYLRRGDWFLLRADAIGIARPRIILTEFAWDNLPNIKSYIEPLRQQFGIDRYFRDMRGINTYANVWRWYWPDWSMGKAACEQLIWSDAIYPPEYLGFDMFSWTANPQWAQTDMSGRENSALFEMHACLQTYSQN